jgi:hypothetical protein
MKTLTVGTEFFQADGRTDGQTDIMKLRVAFRNFSKAPKNECQCYAAQSSCDSSCSKEGRKDGWTVGRKEGNP